MEENSEISSCDLDAKIEENFIDIERDNKQKLLNLIAEIIIKATLRELYETRN